MPPRSSSRRSYGPGTRRPRPPSEPEAGDEDQPGESDAAHAAYLKRRLIVSLALFIPLTDLSMMLSLVPSLRFPGWQWLLVACAAPVALWCAWPFHRAALKNARHAATTMDTLVSLGIVAACGWSVYAMFALDRGGAGGTLWQRLIHNSGGGIYLETAATVTTFLLAGRLYEARARRIAGQAMRDLAAAAASEVSLLEPGGTERRVPATRLRPGDRFVVRPGETIAADGEVEFGQTAVDRSMMTGESVPGEAAEGDSVTGGTVVLTGRVVVRAVNVGRDTQLARLISLVEQAQAQKAAIQRVADRICGVFVPAVLVCAVGDPGGLAAGRLPGRARVQRRAGGADHRLPVRARPGDARRAGRRVRPGRRQRDIRQGVPGARVVAGGRRGGPRQDRDGHHRPDGAGRRAARRRRRPGRPAQVRGRGRGGLRALGRDGDQRGRAGRNAARCPWPEAFRALPGLGARGTVDGREIVIGRARLLAEHGMAVDGELTEECGRWERAGRTAVLVGWDGAVRGAIAVADTVKDSAAAAVAELRALGLHPILLTGDSEATARAVAAEAGIDEVIAGTLPAGKAAVIDGLRARGHRVAMVGDGINDGPALAAADLGLALGSGTDVAICAADVILLRDDLRCVPDAIRLSRATFATIRANLVWAFGYNVAAIPLAALGLLNPILAAAAMTLSSVFVVANSLRLQRYPLRAATRERSGRRHARLHPRLRTAIFGACGASRARYEACSGWSRRTSTASTSSPRCRRRPRPCRRSRSACSRSTSGTA